MGFQGDPKALPFGDQGKWRLWSRKPDDRSYRLLYGMAVAFTWYSAKHAKERTRNSKKNRWWRHLKVMEFYSRRFSCDNMTFLACGSWHSNRVDIRSILKCEKTWKSVAVFHYGYYKIWQEILDNFLESVDLVCKHSHLGLSNYITWVILFEHWNFNRSSGLKLYSLTEKMLYWTFSFFFFFW